MPLEPTTPESKDVPSTVSKDITHLHVTNLGIVIDPNDASATVVHVTWEEGYMEGSAFIRVGTKDVTLSGPDVIAKINETTDGTTSVYNNVKQRVWEMLQNVGQVPSGDIT
jgi:hypothetical protein